MIERDKNKASLKDYLKYSKHWFQYEFDDDFFDEYGGKDAKKYGVKVIDEAEWVRISECAVKSKVVKPKGLIPVKDHSEKVSKANKKYCFTVQIRIVDENYESEFVYSLAKIVRPNWKKAKTRAKTRGKGENKWCFIDCEEVIRCADGTSYFDDNLIPQGPDVAEQLLEILDV